MLGGVALQDWADFLQTLTLSAPKRVMHLVQAPIHPLEHRIQICRVVIALEEAVDAGAKHRRITPHIPTHVAVLGQLQMAIQAQLGHHLGPALGNRLLDGRHTEDPGLDHLQHIFNGQGRIDPFDDDRRALAVDQSLIKLANRLASHAAGGQCQAAPGKLLKVLVTSIALTGNDDQRHILANCRTGAEPAATRHVKELTGRDQIAFTALQSGQQLILGPWNQFQLEAAAIARIAIEILLEGPQAVVFDADTLTFDFTRAVTALIDQHAQLTAAANACQVTGGLGLLDFQRASHTRHRCARQQQ